VSTVFSAAREEFSKRAHLAAEAQFYPQLFHGWPVAFEDVTNTVRDLQYAIDYQAAVTVDGLRAPLRFSIQERWRDPSAMQHGDITITEWNLDTGRPSELHKLGAHLFVYGFYDTQADQISAAVAASVPHLLLGLLNGLQYQRRRRGDQSFVALQVAHLKKAHAVLSQMRAPKQNGSA
jgi:hypothetical protein